MKKLLLSMAALPLMIGGLSVTASADDGINIFENIKVKGQIRPRFEGVDDGNDATANASAYTARTKLSATADLLGVDGLSATVGLISVNNFGSHEYNWDDSDQYTDGTKPYSKVVDPQQAMISNAEVNYKVDDTLVHVGRSQINLDNQRFIGTVGWRQFERSYDAAYVTNNSVKNLSVLAAWVYGYQGVSAGETIDTNSILLHAAYTVMPELKITAYDYMIANKHDTYGIALTGKVKTDMAKLSYRAEYALQKDATMEMGVQTPTTGIADASYMNLDLGANVNGILAGVNYEFLSGEDGTATAFDPTLGTNHKFNGWADVFYVGSKPAGGLRDLNVRLGYTAKGFGKLLAVYHNFTADKAKGTGVVGVTSDDLGSEFDALYTNKIPGVNNLTGLVKYASYSGGAVAGYTNDVQKVWLGLDYKFATK